jgi:hypothetical protein
MTSRGRRIAFFIAVGVAMALPKREPCRFPGDECSQVTHAARLCNSFETEPFGVYLIEYGLERDLGIAYSHDLECF